MEAGANPNCISTSDNETILDWVQFDYWLEFEIDGHAQFKEYEPIIEVLKQYGAKSYDEIITKNGK